MQRQWEQKEPSPGMAAGLHGYQIMEQKDSPSPLGPHLALCFHSTAGRHGSNHCPPIGPLCTTAMLLRATGEGVPLQGHHPHVKAESQPASLSQANRRQQEAPLSSRLAPVPSLLLTLGFPLGPSAKGLPILPSPDHFQVRRGKSIRKAHPAQCSHPAQHLLPLIVIPLSRCSHETSGCLKFTTHHSSKSN